MDVRRILTGTLCAAGLSSAAITAEETVVLPTAAAWGGGDIVGSQLIGRTYNAGKGPGIWIVADGGFRLYCNGELLAQDNAAGRVTFVPYTFLPGKNAISVVGVDGNGAPGVLVQIDELEKAYASGSGWKVSTTVSDNSWKKRDFDDASWASATASGSASTLPSGATLAGFASGSSAKWIWASSASTRQAVLRYAFTIKAEGFGAATTGGLDGTVTIATDSTSIVAAMQDAVSRIVLVPEGTYDLRRFVNAATTATASGWTWCKRPCGSGESYTGVNTNYRINFAANSCGSDETIVKESDKLMSWGRWIPTKANKTLIGMGRGANLRGGEFYMRTAEGAKNQIYRNLAIYDVNPHMIEAGDGLSVSGASDNRASKLWIDHVSYKWISDGLDIEYLAEGTISYLDHDGRNDKNCHETDPYIALVEDADLTYANVYWHGTMGRVPKAGSAKTSSRVHIYNTLIDTNTYYMIGADGGSSSVNTQVLFENNYVNRATFAYTFQSANSSIKWTGNTLANSTAKFYVNNVAGTTAPNDANVFTPPYSYSKRTVANLPTEIPLNAGVGGRWGSMPTYNQAFGQSNKAPTVAITSPASGASLVAPATLSLSATASDADGSVKSVAFYVGNTLVGTATASPWTVSVSNVPAGTHSIVAVATDDSGLSRVSDFVTIVATQDAPVFTSGKSFSVPENTVAVATCAATGSTGKTIGYSIAGGDDSARFSIDPSKGTLVFKAAPDWETPLDEGADNIYKVVVSASDGTNATSQSIAIQVTDVDESVGVGHGADRMVEARVSWMDLRGTLVAEGVQFLDASDPRPVAPSGLRGLHLARVRIDGRPERVQRVVLGSR